jgi:vancomycin permeability regulator SanA
MHHIFEKAQNCFAKHKRRILSAIIFIAYIVVLIAIFTIILNINIIAKTNDNIYTVDELIKVSDDFDCILILGAGIRRDGSPTPMLNDRLTAGSEAFFQGKSELIFLSGDSESIYYTETVTMKNTLVENGIDENLIICDGYGLSTYESIWRAKNVYGFDKILIISQKYHLHRAIYISEKLGINAYGVDSAYRTYVKQPLYSAREMIARLKDILYSEIEPLPTYLDKWEITNE